MRAKKRMMVLWTLACLPVLAVGVLGCAAQPTARTFLCAGNESYRAARYQEAVVGYSKAIREVVGRGRFGRDHLAQAYLNRGSALEQLGRHEQAIADYDKAASLAFWDTTPYLKRAAVQHKLQQYGKAAADYTEAIRLQPGNGRTYCRRALAYNALGKTDLAAQDVQMAQALLPGDEAPRRVRAAIQAKAGLTTPAQGPERSELYAAGECFERAAAGEWAFTVTPYVWVPDVEGNATVQGIKTPANWSMSDTLRELDWTTAGRVEAWRDGWGLIFDGLYVRTGGSNNHPVPTISGVDISVELLTLDVAGSYRLVDVFVGKGDDDAAGTKYPRLIFEPLAGLRLVYLNQEVKLNPGPASVQDSTTYVEPFVGGRVAVDLTEHLSVGVRGDIGGFGVGEASEKTWTLMPGVMWRISNMISLNAAYRITAMDFQQDRGTDTFANDTTLKGPVIGLGIHF